MTTPLVQAFFVGRAVAEILSERLEHSVTDALSQLGKLDAELREQMRSFTDEVMVRAASASEAAGANFTSPSTTGQSASIDTQAMIDDLRAEIATLRTELQRHRVSG